MSVVAVAVVGGAVVGAYATNQAAGAQSQAVQYGADASAAATIQATEMQIAEARRQFDYQQQILLPQIQQQYNAQGAFSDLMGIGGLQPGQNAETGYIPEPRSYEEQERQRAEDVAMYQGFVDEGLITQEEADREIATINSRPSDQDQMRRDAFARGPQMPGAGSTTFERGRQGEFLDRNLDPTQLADVNTYGDTVRRNLQAGSSADEDEFRNYIAENGIAAGSSDQDAQVRRAADVTMTDARGGDSLMDARGGDSLMDARGGDSLMDARGGDLLANGAAGTGVYGEDFRTSPGYEFAVEEMNRASDRVGSAGGNFGGRAMIEAQRRAKGLADSEYYNWAQGRTSDLSRQATAEARDAGRLDNFAAQDISRRDSFAASDMSRRDSFAASDQSRLDNFAASDIGRGDRALAGYEAQRIADVERGDRGYENYLQRRQGDAARLDAAAQQEDSLRATDIQRKDQAYYNYLQNLKAQAGFGGGPAAQAVQSSQAAGATVANAYGSQGASLSSTYQNLGQNQANIAGSEIAGYNNAVQSGISNYLTYQNSQPTRQPPIS